MLRRHGHWLFLGLAILYTLVSLVPGHVRISFQTHLLILLSMSVSIIWQVFAQRGRESSTIVVALVLTMLWALLPHTFFDDTGFIIRYLHQAAHGQFFHFNAQDPPVFGVSGFLYGCMTMLAALAGVPDRMAILLTQGLGWIFVLLSLLGLFQEVTAKHWPKVFLPLAVVLCSANLINVAWAGLEAPFHVGLVLLGWLALFREKWEWALLGTALIVMSKLDAAPVAVIIGGYTLIAMPGSIGKRAVTGLVWAVLPLLMWLGGIYLIFGSVIPQSGYAKLHFHYHITEGWFPFLDHFRQHSLRLIALVAAVVVSIAGVSVCIWKGQVAEMKFWLPGLAAAGILAMYYWYNPGERMMWYYALPELLVWFQLMLAIGRLLHRLQSAVLPEIIAQLACMVLILPPVNDMIFFQQYVRSNTFVFERHREDIGAWIASLPASDTLMAFHGYMGADFPGYVVDGTGLNYKPATDDSLQLPRMFDHFRPNWIIFQVNYGGAASLTGRPYTIDTAFFDPIGSWVPYLMLHRIADPRAFAQADTAWTHGWESFSETDAGWYRSDTMLHIRSDIQQVSQLVFGVVRLPFKQKYTVRLLGGDGQEVIRSYVIPAFEKPEWRLFTVRIPCDAVPFTVHAFRIHNESGRTEIQRPILELIPVK